MPKTAQQLRALPRARAFALMGHGAVAVQLQAWPVGVRAFGVDHAVRFAERVVLHLQVLAAEGQQGFALVLMQTRGRGHRAVGDRAFLGERADVRVPQPPCAVGPLDRDQAFDKGREFEPRQLTDAAARRKQGELQHAVGHPRHMFPGFGAQALGPIDEAFEHLVQDLVRAVDQHQFAEHRHERGQHQ